MIHIKKQNNGVNSQKDTELLDGAYFDVIKELANDVYTRHKQQ